MKYLEKLECVNDVMTISTILQIDRQKWGALEIIQIIDDGVCYAHVGYFQIL